MRDPSDEAAQMTVAQPAGLLAAVGIGQAEAPNGFRGPDYLPPAKFRAPVIPWEAIHPVPFRVPPITANGSYDFPNQLGPNDPYWWDLRRVGIWGFLPPARSRST